jgi:Kef-type K+ transport system membrane component KefB
VGFFSVRFLLPSWCAVQLSSQLGPTAFGRIPGFSKHIFPSQSIPFLSLSANIGLCLFLFLVGLEIDVSIIRRNARLSVAVAGAGIVIPFAFGAALAIPLYKHFIESTQVSYTHFMLFTGVAYSITAFPVLCRILTELKLLDTTVGIVVLSAGVGNDIIGWTLLALSVALVNAGSGLTALWVLLVCIGWTLFMLFLVSKVLLWFAHNTGSIENGPTIFFMTITILTLFSSAFFTDVIGVHAIFGRVFHIGRLISFNLMYAQVHFSPESLFRVKVVSQLHSPRSWKIWSQ